MTGQFLQRRNSPTNYYGCFLISLGAQLFLLYPGLWRAQEWAGKLAFFCLNPISWDCHWANCIWWRINQNRSRGWGWSSVADCELSCREALRLTSRTRNSRNKLKNRRASTHRALPPHRPPGVPCLTQFRHHPERAGMLLFTVLPLRRLSPRRVR